MSTINDSMIISSTGYWNGTDPYHAISNPLSDWIIKYLNNKKSLPIYDFGCGNGMYLAKLSKAGFIKLYGYEGDPPKTKVFDNILKQDLTKPFYVADKGIVISLEVAEHIPQQFTDQYLNNIANACLKNYEFIASWAIRGQGGQGHCNELDNDEAIELISSKGFIYLKKETIDARSVILDYLNIDGGHLPWFKNTILIFKKKK